jgi:hypothetical protein
VPVGKRGHWLVWRLRDGCNHERGGAICSWRCRWVALGVTPRKQCYFTEEQVAEALRAGEGRLSRAAKMLGCCAKTVREYIDRFPALADVEYEFCIAENEMAEDVVKAHLKNCNLNAAQFRLNKRDPRYKTVSASRTEMTANASGITLSVEMLKLSDQDQAAA